MIIVAWEHKRQDRAWISLPKDGPRYLVRAFFKKWIAHRIRFVPGSSHTTGRETLGTFATAAEGKRHCENHAKEKP